MLMKMLCFLSVTMALGESFFTITLITTVCIHMYEVLLYFLHTVVTLLVSLPTRLVVNPANRAPTTIITVSRASVVSKKKLLDS